MDKKTLEKEIGALETTNRQLRLKTADLENEISKLQNKRSSLRTDIEELQARQKKEADQLKNIMKETKSVQEDIENKLKENRNIQSQIRDKESELKARIQKQVQAENQLSEDISALKNDQSRLKNDARLIAIEKETIAQEKISIASDKDNIVVELNRIKKANEDLHVKANINECSKHSLMEAMVKANKLTNSLNAKTIEADKRLSEIAVKEHQIDIIEKQNAAEKKDNEIQLQKNIEESNRLSNKEKSLERITQALKVKEDEIEIKRLRVEKIIRDKGIAEELQNLQKELGN